MTIVTHDTAQAQKTKRTQHEPQHVHGARVTRKPAPQARTFCEGWQMYQRYGLKPPAGAFATLEAQVGWEEAHGAATKVKFPRWATDFNGGWDAFYMARPVGATIRSNAAMAGWRAAQADVMAMDVDRFEIGM